MSVQHAYPPQLLLHSQPSNSTSAASDRTAQTTHAPSNPYSQRAEQPIPPLPYQRSIAAAATSFLAVRRATHSLFIDHLYDLGMADMWNVP